MQANIKGWTYVGHPNILSVLRQAFVVKRVLRPSTKLPLVPKIYLQKQTRNKLCFTQIIRQYYIITMGAIWTRVKYVYRMVTVSPVRMESSIVNANSAGELSELDHPQTKIQLSNNAYMGQAAFATTCHMWLLLKIILLHNKLRITLHCD